MQDKERGTPRPNAHDVVRDNLALWQKEIALFEELLVLQAQSMAKTVPSGPQDPDATAEKASRLRGQDSHSLAVNAAQISQRLALSRELRARPQSEPRAASIPPLAHVAMLGGPAFAAALADFSNVIPTPRPLFCHSFADIFEEVAGGGAPFGILPIEDSAQGRLFRIYEQCESYELHIACTTDIKDEGGKTVRMALLYKNDAPDTREELGERVLECLLYGDEGALIELLTAATSLGFTLRRVDSLPLSYREDGFVQHVVLHGARGDRDALFSYLEFFMPHTIVTADYIHIKAREV